MGKLRHVATMSLLILLSSYASAVQRVDNAEIAWITDYRLAYQQAQDQNKPVLVYVWTEKRHIVQPHDSTSESREPYRASGEIHPLSREYTSPMWRSTKVARESQRFVCLSVNIDTPSDFAQRCVQQRAQVFFTDPQGNVLRKFTGSQDLGVGLPRKVFEPDDILRVMRKVKWPNS